MAPTFRVNRIYMSNAVSDCIASVIAIGFIIAEMRESLEDAPRLSQS